MLSLRHPKSLVAAAIVFCALVAALPSAGGRLSQDTGHSVVAKVLCVETRGGYETRGDVRLASADASAVSAGSLSRAALVVSEGSRELQARPALAERLVRLVRQAPRGFPELLGHAAQPVSLARSVSVAPRVSPARSGGRGRQVRAALRAHRE